MTSTDLLEGRYAPFLRFSGFASIRHVVDPASFRTESRSKGLAVSRDGKVFRMVLKPEGYQDRFLERDGAAVLVYVCGLPEERRRQHRNRAGDAVTVVLDRKSDDAHAILRGTFLDIVAHRESKPDGTELLVPHSHIRIEAFTRPDGPEVALVGVDGGASPRKRARSADVEPEHLFLDTESAAPFDERLLGRRHDPFPILQHAFVRTDGAFERLASGCEYVRYPEELRDALGNDGRSSVLKIGLDKLRGGCDARRVLERLYDELARVVATGGCLFAHNVLHDLRQLERTAELLAYAWPAPLVLRTIDTVKVAPNFVPGATERWMRLEELARVSGMPAPAEAYHDAETDTRVLWRIVATHFRPEALDAYVEPYALGK